MFSFADKNMDGKLSFKEFEVRSTILHLSNVQEWENTPFPWPSWPAWGISIIRLHVTCPCSGDDEAPDPPRDSEAAHHGHRHDASDVQSTRRLQAGQGDMLRTKISCFELKITDKMANQVPPGLWIGSFICSLNFWRFVPRSSCVLCLRVLLCFQTPNETLSFMYKDFLLKTPQMQSTHSDTSLIRRLSQTLPRR